MFIWGHRGCRGISGIDENTVEAFRWAIDKGCDGLEFDVQLSSDGVPFVFHDDCLTRLTAGQDHRRVESMRWSELSAVRLAAGGSIPSLEQMRHFAAPGFRMNLEIKTLRAVNPVIEFLRKWDCSDWIVSSFLFEALISLQEALPLQPMGYLLECAASETVADCFERAMAQIPVLKTDRIHLDNDLASRRESKWLFEGEYQIHVWTVNDEARGRELQNRGAKGVFTDDVRLFG